MSPLIRAREHVDNANANAAVWEGRVDEPGTPTQRRAASAAVDAIDAALRELYTARVKLISETRRADEAVNARIDTRLAGHLNAGQRAMVALKYEQAIAAANRSGRPIGDRQTLIATEGEKTPADLPEPSQREHESRERAAKLVGGPRVELSRKPRLLSGIPRILPIRFAAAGSLLMLRIGSGGNGCGPCHDPNRRRTPPTTVAPDSDTA